MFTLIGILLNSFLAPSFSFAYNRLGCMYLKPSLKEWINFRTGRCFLFDTRACVKSYHVDDGDVGSERVRIQLHTRLYLSSCHAAAAARSVMECCDCDIEMASSGRQATFTGGSRAADREGDDKNSTFSRLRSALLPAYSTGSGHTQRHTSITEYIKCPSQTKTWTQLRPIWKVCFVIVI